MHRSKELVKGRTEEHSNALATASGTHLVTKARPCSFRVHEVAVCTLNHCQCPSPHVHQKEGTDRQACEESLLYEVTGARLMRSGILFQPGCFTDISPKMLSLMWLFRFKYNSDRHWISCLLVKFQSTAKGTRCTKSRVECHTCLRCKRELVHHTTRMPHYMSALVDASPIGWEGVNPCIGWTPEHSPFVVTTPPPPKLPSVQFPLHDGK